MSWNVKWAIRWDCLLLKIETKQSVYSAVKHIHFLMRFRRQWKDTYQKFKTELHKFEINTKSSKEKEGGKKSRWERVASLLLLPSPWSSSSDE